MDGIQICLELNSNENLIVLPADMWRLTSALTRGSKKARELKTAVETRHDYVLIALKISKRLLEDLAFYPPF